MAYEAGGSRILADAWRNTTGEPSALVIDVKDEVGTQLVAGCQDILLVQVRVASVVDV